MVNSNLIPNFRQYQPSYGKTDDASGWKTINGYINEAKQLTTCILKNNRPLIHHIVINIDADLEESEHRKLWAVVSKSLRQARVEAVYIRELNRQGNRIHYHLLTVTHHKALKRTIKNALPKACKSVVRVQVERVKDQWDMAWYFTKGKIAGNGENGKWQLDKHKGKRRLFTKDCRLQKWGTIGSFWTRAKKAIWQEVIAHERKLAERKTAELVHEATQLYSLIDGYTSLKTVIRTLAHFEIRERRESCRGKIGKKVCEKFCKETTLGHGQHKIIHSLWGEETHEISKLADNAAWSTGLPSVQDVRSKVERGGAHEMWSESNYQSPTLGDGNTREVSRLQGKQQSCSHAGKATCNGRFQFQRLFQFPFRPRNRSP